MSTSEIVGEVVDLVTLSQGDLARGISVTAQTISKWRNGKRLPHPDNLLALADWMERQGQRIAEAATLLRSLATDLRDPEIREKHVQTVERPREDKPRKLPKGGPPQLRTRKGCWRPGRWFRRDQS